MLKSITLGHQHTCGLTPAGKAYCWGLNEDGQLGDGTTTDRSTPVAVAGDLIYGTLAAGSRHNCGFTTEGAVYCWGLNHVGQLGDGATADRAFPARVAGGPQFVRVAVGGGSSCGLTAADSAYCWGENWFGNFGNNKEVVEGACALDPPVAGSPRPHCTSPVLAAYRLTLRVLEPGTFNSCGLALDSRVYCWGSNVAGQLGDGTTMDRLTPMPVRSDLSYADLSGQAWYACALRDDGGGDWDCWGHLPSDYLARHSVGSVMGATVPAPLAPGLKFRSVSVGNQVACGITDDGAAYCWGDHLHGALGDGRTRNAFNFNDQPSMTPRRVLGEHTFSTVVAGLWRACGLTAEGVSYCWGLNDYGQLGDGTTVDRAEPVKVRAP